MDRRTYYLMKARDAAELAKQTGDISAREMLRDAARSWMVLHDAEDSGPLGSRRRYGPAAK